MSDRQGGSSPRTRGTVGVGFNPEDRQRLIPAHAGNGAGATSEARPHPAHPRARGERATGVVAGNVAGGSSPRTRGTGALRGFLGRLGRLIPAHAGNGCRDVSCCPNDAAHPRARGEREWIRSVRSCAIGSSPRTRGTEHRRHEVPGGRRLIPAHAGNGPRRDPRPRNCAAHPRARGERLPVLLLGQTGRGSSPRTRGTEGAREPEAPCKRLIPAHAGNGPPRSGTPRCPTAHPRARGERCPSRVTRSEIVGSSPRTRGTGVRDEVPHSALRLIPAHAGNGRTACARRPGRAAHPRARGERFRSSSHS